jgi:feruloyl-CoA synthase
VITGHDRDDIGALVFFNVKRVRQLTGLADGDRAVLSAHPALRAFLSDVLLAHNAAHSSSSTRIAMLLLLPDEPDRSAGELTDKGTVNQRIALARRSRVVDALYERPDAPDIIRPSRPMLPTLVS